LTPRQWCERQSLTSAAKWLQDGRFSIKEIAARLRFTDSSHFAKWFRRHLGKSPTDYQAVRL
jgi:AraC-like DNA-binding protein